MTSNVYADWDVDQLAETMSRVLAEDTNHFNRSIAKPPRIRGFRANSGDGGNRTHVRDRVRMASTSVAGALISSLASLAGRVERDQPP